MRAETVPLHGGTALRLYTVAALGRSVFVLEVHTDLYTTTHAQVNLLSARIDKSVDTSRPVRVLIIFSVAIPF